MTFADFLFYALAGAIGFGAVLALVGLWSFATEALDNLMARAWKFHGWCARCDKGRRFRVATYDYTRRHPAPFDCEGCTWRMVGQVGACAAILGLLLLWIFGGAA